MDVYMKNIFLTKNLKTKIIFACTYSHGGRAMRLLKSCLLLLIITVISGCGNGFDCPSNVPSCCYDSLFGCEIFDLPPTCSCSDYGIFRTKTSSVPQYQSRQNRAVQTLNTQRAGSLTGDWSGILDRKKSSCGSFLKQVNGVIQIRDKKNILSIKVLHYGALHGRKQKNGFYATGTYKPPLLSCSARVSVYFQRRTSGIGKVQANINYSCGTTYSCTSSYSGAVQKQ